MQPDSVKKAVGRVAVSTSSLPPMQKIAITASLCCFIVQAGLSQDVAPERKFEIAGSLGYSYSKSVENSFRTFHTFARYYRVDEIALQPSLGYFPFRHIEVLIEPRFTASYVSQNFWTSTATTTLGEPIEGSDGTFVGSFRLYLGAAYIAPVTESTELFASAKVGLGWSLRTYDSGPNYYVSGIQKAEISFPVFAGGAKIHVSEEWAIILQAEWNRTNNFMGNEDVTHSGLVVSIGCAAYL